MATNVEVGDILQVTMVTEYKGQRANNVRHYRVMGIDGIQPASDVAFVQEFIARVKTEFIAGVDSEATFKRTRVQIISPLRKAYYDQDVAGGGGSAISDGLPPQCAGLIRFLGQIANRSGRGRMYVPYPTRGDMSAESRPTPAYLTILDELAAKLMESITITVGITETTFAPVLYNRDTDAYQLITSYRVIDAFASQRRRSFVNRADY